MMIQMKKKKKKNNVYSMLACCLVAYTCDKLLYTPQHTEHAKDTRYMFVCRVTT